MIRIKSGFSGERSLVLPKMVTSMMSADAIASVLYITDIGYYPNADAHFREREEPVDQYVFIYCVAGRGFYVVNGQRYDVEPNQYFILPAGVPHAYGADALEPWTIYWIHFKGTLARHYAQNALAPISVRPGMKSRISYRTSMFEELFEALNSGYGIENIRYAMSLFHHYLGSLRYLRQYRECGTDVQAGTASDEDAIVSAAIHYIKENIERHFTLKDLADYTGYSQSRFSVIFKERTGHSPVNYVNLIKMKEACSMLDNTQMKVNQICHKLGIDDPYYFSRLFSSIMGMSPKMYRQTPKV